MKESQKMKDTFLRITKKTYKTIKKAQAAEIGRRGVMISLKKFTEQIVAAGLKSVGKKKY